MRSKRWFGVTSSLKLCVLALALGASCCGPSRHAQPVVITLSGHFYWRMPSWQRSIQDFSRETGVEVKLIAYSDEAEDTRRVQYADWLHRHARTPDVYQTDISFLSAIADDLLDLSPYAAADARAHFPAIVEHDLFGGRLVALPLYTDITLLYYRTDLLRKYGYPAPPKTWAELERMALAIQTGERAAGHKDFWGYVWEGNPANEGLTASAFEWQVSGGGGHIIEPEGCIAVDNPATVEGLERAHRWIGRISPPGTVEYGPGDVANVWAGGRAAFMRNWPEFLSRKLEQGTFDLIRLPAGHAGAAGTLGGWNLGVSRYSAHPAEAVHLVRFLTSREAQLAHALSWGVTPSRGDVYQSRELLERFPQFARVYDALSTSAVARPSAAARSAYPRVSGAYAKAALSVLTGKTPAAAAMADLEKELVSITGFAPCKPAGAK